MLAVIDPIAFRLFGWPVHWYGLIIGCGMLLSYAMIIREGQRKGLSTDFLGDLYFWTIIVGLIGARLYYVVFRWDYYAQHPEQIVQIWQGGGAIYGAILAGALTVWWGARHYHQDVRLILDVAAPAVLLAQAIGRWGNFVNQEAYGAVTTAAALEAIHLPQWLIQQMYINGSYYQPTFLYESVWSLLGVGLLCLLRRVPALLQRGEVAASYFIWYGLGRVYIEGLRSDSLYFLGFRVSQLVSLILIVTGIVWIGWSRRYQPHDWYSRYSSREE